MLKEFVQLGHGVHGIVYSCQDPKLGKKYAVKIWKVGDVSKKGIYGHVNMKELDIYYNFSNVGLVKAIKVLPTDSLGLPLKVEVDKFCIVYNYAISNLAQYKHKITDCKSVFFDLISGLRFLHHKGVIHRDIKSANVLVFKNDDQVSFKLTDFGLSKFSCALSKRNSSEIGTHDYMAPELLLGKEDYNEGVDIWAMACVFMEIVKKKKIFISGNHDKNYERCISIFDIMGYPEDKDMERLCGKFHNSMSGERNKINVERMLSLDNNEKALVGDHEKFIDLISKMLSYDYTNRISANDCMKHPYFSDMKFLELPELEDKIYTYNKNAVKRDDGFLAFDIFVGTKNEEILKGYKYRIVFLAMALYERVLFNKHYDRYGMEEIAYACIYIAYKYFIDFNVQSLKTIIPTTENKFSPKRMSYIEEDLLVNFLNFKIFEPTIYEFIKNGNVSEKTLLITYKLFSKCSEDIYGKKLSEISEYIDNKH